MVKERLYTIETNDWRDNISSNDNDNEEYCQFKQNHYPAKDEVIRSIWALIKGTKTNKFIDVPAIYKKEIAKHHCQNYNITNSHLLNEIDQLSNDKVLPDNNYYYDDNLTIKVIKTADQLADMVEDFKINNYKCIGIDTESLYGTHKLCTLQIANYNSTYIIMVQTLVGKKITVKMDTIFENKLVIG